MSDQAKPTTPAAKPTAPAAGAKPSTQTTNAPVKAAPNAIPAPPVTTTTAAAPTGEAPKARSNRDKRARYTNIPEDGLLEVPTDFDPKKFQPLKRSDFNDERVWLRLRAEAFEKAAKEARDEIEEITKGGGTKGVKKAKSLAKVQTEMDELLRLLKLQGVNTDSAVQEAKANAAKILAEKAAADAAAKAAPATAPTEATNA